MLSHLSALVAGLVVGAALLLAAPSVAFDSDDDDWVPPPDTIVAVEGDAANGFGIYFLDGSSIFPPTDSEAFAECSEYDTRVARVRCRTEVRIWYRDLADLQQALRYAHLE